jgi:hypothetical protein
MTEREKKERTGEELESRCASRAGAFIKEFNADEIQETGSPSMGKSPGGA